MSNTTVDNIKFFSECTAEEQLAILEAARIALQDENVLSHMDVGNVLAIPLVDRLITFLGEPPKPEGFRIAKPQISISNKLLAIFDEFTIVREFRPFLDEAKAIADAKAWIKQYSDVEPEVVRPIVRKMVITRGKGRR